jgi:hypothetical protein
MNLTGLQAEVLAAFLSRGVPVRLILDEDGMDAYAADGEGLFLDSNADPGIGGYRDGPWRILPLDNGDLLLGNGGRKARLAPQGPLAETLDRGWAFPPPARVYP